MIWIINFDSIMNWCPIRENKTSKHQIHFCMEYTMGYLYLINPIWSGSEYLRWLEQ